MLQLKKDMEIEAKVKEAEQFFLDYRLNEAYEMFKSLAEQGSGRAMYFLGEFYTHGYGKIEKDAETGKRWREKGAEQGDVLAKLNIAYSLPQESDQRRQIFSSMFAKILELAET